MRQLRNRRHHGVRIQLTDRDRHVLEVLSRFRLVRTSDLVLTCFRGVQPTTAGMRLRRLFDAGYLAVHSSEIGRENIYALGRAASNWKTGRIPRGTIEHHLAIVRAWSLLAANVPGTLNLELARADWELREEVSGAEIIPDLFMVLNGRGLAVEVDLGTESLPVLRRKLETYASIDRLFGYPFVVSIMADRRVPGIHCWTEADGPASCYELLLQQL